MGSGLVPAPPPGHASQADRQMKTYAFKDPRTLGNWLSLVALALIVLHLVDIGFAYRANGVLYTIVDGAKGAPALDTVTKAGAETQAMLQLPGLVLFLATVVLFSIWLENAAGNARALGARGFDYSPAWTVAWFFVPVANLVMPYFTMREVWQSSANPRDWSENYQPGTVLGWWLTWLASNLFTVIAAIRTKHAVGNAYALVQANDYRMVGLVLLVVSTALFIGMVRRIDRMQADASEHRPLRAPEASAVAGASAA